MIVPYEYHNKRLDQALAQHPACENMGLRGRRRLCEEGLVYVNNRERTMSYKVFEGQEITVKEPSLPSIEELREKPYVIKESADYIAFYKPGEMASVIIKGKPSLSLEACVASFTSEKVTLLTRLDTLTSGIILGAKNLEAAERYRTAQENCLVAKKYKALAEGIITQAQTIDLALDTSEPKVIVTPYSNPEKNQHTLIRPLEEKEGNTLVECTIFKGQRHQIRVHLASIGHPLVADTLYGARPQRDTQPYLSHYALEFDEFDVKI